MANTPAIKKIRPFVPIIAGVTGFLVLLLFIFPPMMEKDPVPEDSGSQDQPPQEENFQTEASLTFFDSEQNPVQTIQIAIAETELERQQGLMGVTAMDDNQGMLFIFEVEEERSFWMANTVLPLDIIYVNSSKEIVSIQRNAKPYSKESLPSNFPAIYVVEVNAGFCDKYGVHAGYSVSWQRY